MNCGSVSKNSDELEIHQGVTQGHAIEMLNLDETPADLTGWTVKCQVREREDSNSLLLHEFSTFTRDNYAGIKWTAEETMKWSWPFGFADIVLVNPAGVPVQIIWQGIITIDKVVTK